MSNRIANGFLLLTLASSPVLTGCIVPQAAGRGMARHQVEPITGSSYWLYLPDDYMKNDGQRADGRRWPLVVTFHGMKPWDNAGPQCREWQEEADRYGFIILAPQLRTCDSFMQFPLKDRTLPYVMHDERAVLAMMDEVFRRTNADPTRVLSTSWSSGGYIAHFMVNQYPERFTVLAVRQSNFSEHLLDAANAPAYRNMRIGIFFGENDLPVCRNESLKAVEWYRHHHFHVDAKLVSGLGHERTPQTAAAYFALAIGVKPKTPPRLYRVMEDIPIDQLEKLRRKQSRRRSPSPGPVADAAEKNHRPGPSGKAALRLAGTSDRQRSGSSGRALSSGASVEPARADIVAAPKRVRQRPTLQPYGTIREPAQRTPRRPRQLDLPTREKSPSSKGNPRIRVHGENVGRTPMWVRLSIDMPSALRDGASILWTDNNQPIGSDGFSTQALLRQPGDHLIEARITTANNRQIILSETINVLPESDPTSQPAGA